MITVVAVVCLGSGMTSATAAQARVGVKGGFNITDFHGGTSGTGDTFAETKNRHPAAGGLFVSIPIGSRVSITPEVLLTGKGFKQNDVISGIPVEVTVKFNALQFPLLLNVVLGPTDAVVTSRLFVGPAVTFELSCDLTFDRLLPELPCDDVADLDRESWDLEAIFGGALDIAGPGRFVFSLEARYDYGLRNLDAAAEPNNFNVKSRAFTFLGGVSLALGR
ncbi:MAG: porin family protein [Gemmatimonadetes bacterium]|nr:porin family protein [Gemmatimonadota bacterium]